MSERFNVDMDDVLGSNYFVASIGVSNYNPQIDGTVTLTVTLKDVYGDNVSGEELTVTCSNGGFTGLNGSTITSTSSVAATTDANGQFTLTYTCTVWGVVSFSTLNAKEHIHVTGFKQVKSYASGFYALLVDGSSRTAKLRASLNNTSLVTGENYTQSGWIPSDYRPDGTLHTSLNRLNTVDFSASSTGDVQLYNHSGSSVTLTTATMLYWDY